MCFNTIRKLLCYVVAGFNIGLMFWIILYVVVPEASNGSTIIILRLLLCFANIAQAVLLIVGVVKDRPSFITAFLSLMLLQMAFLAWVAIQSFRQLEIFRAEKFLWLIVIFSFESLIALDGLHVVMKTLPPAVQPTVLVYPQS